MSPREIYVSVISDRGFHIRRPPSAPTPGQGVVKHPEIIAPHGGTITFSIVTSPKPQTRKAASKVHVDRLLALLEKTTKTRGDKSSPSRTPSDEVEKVQLQVNWAPSFKALSIDDIDPADMQLELAVVSGIALLIGAIHPMTDRAPVESDGRRLAFDCSKGNAHACSSNASKCHETASRAREDYRIQR